MIITAMKILNTFNTMPRSRTCSFFYADRHTTLRNVAQFFAQIDTRRSRIVHGWRALQTIVTINVTWRARHWGIACL